MAPVTILTTAEEGSERVSLGLIPDTREMDCLGTMTNVTLQEARLGIGAREGTESQDSYRLGSQGAEFDDDGSADRKNGNEKVSGWVKLRQTLIGRRSRSGSFAKERGEKGESAASRESGASLKDSQLQHSPSTSISGPMTSSPSTGLHPSMSINIPRGVSPMPPPSPGDFAKYNDSKLMPFPGIYQLEEQRNKWKAGGGPPTPGTGEFPSQPGSSPNNSLLPNPNALSAPLPPSSRHSPDEGSQADNKSLQRNASLNNMRQQDRAWPLPHEDYFDAGASVSRSASAGSYVKKWLKIPTSGSNVPSTSPSPAPYPYPLSYSPAPSAGGDKSTPSAPNLNRRPSAADIFLPHGGLQRRPSTPNLLQGLSRKSSLADAHGSAANGHTLKSTSSKASLRKAFGIFGHESNAKDTPAVVEEEGTSSEIKGVTIVPTMQDAFPKPLVVAPQETHAAPEPAVEIIRPTSPAPLTLPSPSAVPIPIPSNPVNEEVPARTGPTPPPVSRVQSPPPNHSRPQSPPIRAQSPSILKKDFRAQSPPIRTQSPAYDLGGPRSPFLASPTRSHSPFLVHSGSLSRAKGLKALSSADIIASIENLLNRNSTGSSLDGKPKGLEEAPRKLLLVTPVLEVVSRNTVKDRTLFLFSDLLVVAKCMSNTEGGLIMDKSYAIKNILELKRCTGPILSQGSIDLSGDRRSPMLQSFISDFRTNQAQAIAKLCDSVGIRKEEEAIFIADVLFKTFELERPRVGDYLARKTSREVLHAFVDKFGFSGTRIDHALRIFLLSVLLSDEAEPRSLENLLAGFASRWFSANGNMVSFDKECAKNLVVSIVLLNASLHMTHTHQHPPATLQEFIDAVRAYDQRHSIKEDLLEDIYEAVKQEKISAPKANPGEPRFTVTITGATNPMHFVYRVKSDVVRVRIPAADPNFRVHLLGQGLSFDPPTLHFANSSEATFRVTGMSLGSKSILYWRAGANAHLYNSMPLASEITIERPFMRNTLRITYKEISTGRERESVLESSDHGSSQGSPKKSYVFSVEDPREYDHWGKVLKMRINRAAGILDPERPPTAQGIYASIPAMSGGVPPRIRRAAETVALEVLKDTLIGSESSSSVSCLQVIAYRV
jgi:serine/arginine repetitive matrix protein 2